MNGIRNRFEWWRTRWDITNCVAIHEKMKHIAHTINLWPNLKTMANDSYFYFDDNNEITYRYFTIIDRIMGKLKKCSPIHCIGDNWASWPNLRQTRGRIYPKSVLYFPNSLQMRMRYCTARTNEWDLQFITYSDTIHCIIAIWDVGADIAFVAFVRYINWKHKRQRHIIFA